jgi:hypothetical protein
MELKRLYRSAFALALITIGYNVAEGIVSTALGIADDTFALFGFGMDSFIEVISGAGIAHMILRIRAGDGADTDSFERTALRVTGTAFYLLTAALAVTTAYNLITLKKPESTFWGIVISLISIATMGILIGLKTRVGKALGSEPILADANCTRVCLYMSVALLISSAAYELTGIFFIDSLGALALAVFSFREGRECFAKARGGACSCAHK